MKTKNFLGNIVISLLSAFLAIVIYTNYFQDELESTSDRVIQDEKALGLLEDSNQVNYRNVPVNLNGEIFDFTEAAEKSVHAVVHVTSKYNLESDYYSRNPILELLYGNSYERKPSVSFGSGVIISEDGYIVTNNHVVDDSDEIKVVLNDKRTYTAKLVGTDPSTDLALLKVEGKKLPFINMGNSDDLKVGEWVLAVGNPFNLTSTVTAGIVSAKARDINILRDQTAIESFIQTDAAVNQGNSGGALVNMFGELVGINSAILSPSGAYSGYSFAIPINLVKKIVADFIKYGEVQRAVLGVTIKDVNDELAREYNLDKIEGVFIDKVSDNGAAKDAGVKNGDIITQINDVKINSGAELTEQIGKYRPGELVYVTIKRNNKKKQFEVVLRNKQGNTKIVKTNEFYSVLGASFKDIDSRDKRRWGISSGVIISDLKNGVLKDAGLKEDYIILSVDGKEVDDLTEFNEALKAAGMGNAIEIEVTYPGSRYIYVYKVELKENS